MSRGRRPYCEISSLCVWPSWTASTLTHQRGSFVGFYLLSTLRTNRHPRYETAIASRVSLLEAPPITTPPTAAPSHPSQQPEYHPPHTTHQHHHHAYPPSSAQPAHPSPPHTAPAHPSLLPPLNPPTPPHRHRTREPSPCPTQTTTLAPRDFERTTRGSSVHISSPSTK